MPSAQAHAAIATNARSPGSLTGHVSRPPTRGITSDHQAIGIACSACAVSPAVFPRWKRVSSAWKSESLSGSGGFVRYSCIPSQTGAPRAWTQELQLGRVSGEMYTVLHLVL